MVVGRVGGLKKEFSFSPVFCLPEESGVPDIEHSVDLVDGGYILPSVEFSSPRGRGLGGSRFGRRRRTRSGWVRGG